MLSFCVVYYHVIWYTIIVKHIFYLFDARRCALVKQETPEYKELFLCEIIKGFFTQNLSLKAKVFISAFVIVDLIDLFSYTLIVV